MWFPWRRKERKLVRPDAHIPDLDQRVGAQWGAAPSPPLDQLHQATPVAAAPADGLDFAPSDDFLQATRRQEGRRRRQRFFRRVIAVVLILGAVGALAVTVLSGLGVIHFPEKEGLGKRLVIGPDGPNAEEVYYTRSVSKAEAEAVGHFLRKTGHFDGQSPKTVQIIREDDTYLLSIVVADLAWHDAAFVEECRGIGRGLSREVFDGAPVEVRLCTRNTDFRGGEFHLIVAKVLRPQGR
jgi:hypothetical protein